MMLHDETKPFSTASIVAALTEGYMPASSAWMTRYRPDGLGSTAERKIAREKIPTMKIIVPSARMNGLSIGRLFPNVRTVLIPARQVGKNSSCALHKTAIFGLSGVQPWHRRQGPILMRSPISHDAPLLTVIVPVFNEVATIEELLRRVREAPCTKQIVVVDDGSTDGTSAALCKWEQEDDVEVLRHDRNRGKGRAIRTGLERATGRFVLIQDGDLETDPRDYARLVDPLLKGCADIVVGSRFAAGTGAPSGVDPFFRMGVQFLNLAVWLIYGVRLSDEACCYKVLPSETLRDMDLRCERFEFCPEVVAKASRMRLRIAEVPISYSPRSVGSGKKIRYRDGLYALWWLWKLRKFTPRKSEHTSTDLTQIRIQ